jgi:hypothetical protein
MTRAQQSQDVEDGSAADRLDVRYPGLSGALLSDRAGVRTLTQANALLDAFLGRTTPVATAH